MNYPPVSFHVIGALSASAAGVTVAGRRVALLSLAAVTAETALIVYAVSASVSAGVFSALFWLLWLGTYGASYVGLDDPQMLGEALVLAGVLFFIRKPDSMLSLAVACAAFCAGGFVKHSLIVFPVAVSATILIASRRTFLLWCLMSAALLGGLTLLTLRIDGPYFIDHLLAHGTHSFHISALRFAEFIRVFQVPLVVSIAWCWLALRRRWSKLFIFAFLTGAATTFVFRGSAGANVNLSFDWVLTISMICGLAWNDLLVLARKRGRAAEALAAMCPLLFSLGAVSGFPGMGLFDRSALPRLEEQERGFHAGVAYLKSRPGDAICEELLACFEAGKPLVYDPFFANELMKQGRIPEAAILDGLKSGRFATVELNAEEPASPEPRLRFSKAFMEMLLANYRMDRTSGDLVFFVPK